jgi:predicted DNA-binding ribbon-helix-helix protein
MKSHPVRAASNPHLPIRNVIVKGRRTSVRLEPAMWDALQEIVTLQGQTVNQLLTEIDRRRGHASLTSAIRVYIVEFYRSAAHHSRSDRRL